MKATNHNIFLGRDEAVTGIKQVDDQQKPVPHPPPTTLHPSPLDHIHHHPPSPPTFPPLTTHHSKKKKNSHTPPFILFFVLVILSLLLLWLYILWKGSAAAERKSNVDDHKWSCEWCIHEEEQRSIKRCKVFDLLLGIAQSIPGNPSSPPPPLQPSEASLRHSTRRGREKKRAASETNGGDGGSGKASETWKSLAARGRFGCRWYNLLADFLC